MVIDQHMRIWQQNEEPIDILHMPYQSLKVSVQAAAARARTKAEWIRNSSKRIATAEIDRTASQIDPKLTEEQQGIMRTVAMGGDQALQDIANYNEDIDPICTRCGKAPSTVDHLKWECEALEHVRIKADPTIAAIPTNLLPASIRSGIVPAMKLDCCTTFWGAKP